MPDAEAVLSELGRRHETLGTAESLTGGLVAGAITAVAGASAVYVGGVVSYSADVKASVLGVPHDVIASHGTVSSECAEAMAAGARRTLGCDWAVSTTGVAGPDALEGHPVGTVFVGVAGPAGVSSTQLSLAGDRNAIRRQSVAAALSALAEHLGVPREEPPLG